MEQVIVVRFAMHQHINNIILRYLEDMLIMVNITNCSLTPWSQFLRLNLFFSVNNNIL